jgi:muramidase (phage lysozyme)
MANLNTRKFLPAGNKGGSLVKSNSGAISPQTKFFASKKTVKTTDILSKKKQDFSDRVQEDVYEIKLKVIDIEKMLQSSFATQKKDSERKRRRSEKEEFEKKEKDLEKKPTKDDLKKPKIPTPKMGLFDWIKNFIFNTVLGFLAYRLIEHLPTAMKFVSVMVKAADFIIDIGGKLLDGLVTFIDWGYKAYDATRGFIKNMFGDTGAKLFDKFSSTLNTFINLAIIAGLIAVRNRGGMGLGGGKGAGGAASAKGFRGVTTSGGRRVGKPDVRNPFRKKPTVTTSGGKGFKFPGTGPKVTQGVGGKVAQRAALRSLKPILGRLPIIGGLLEFGLSWALGDPIGKAAFRGIGSLLVGAVGAAIGGPIGAAVGGFVGGDIGGKLYDVFFNNKSSKETGNKKGYAEGGKAGNKNRKSRRSKPSGRKLRLGKGKRRITAKLPSAPQVVPGKDIGGEQKLFGLFPNPFAGLFGKKTTEKPQEQPDPFGFMRRSSVTYSKIDFFGPVLTLASNLLLGQKPSNSDFENVALGINALIQQGFAKNKLKGGIITAFAEGGLVDPSITNGDVDLTKWIEQSAKDSIYPKVDSVTRDLMKNMLLKKKEEETQSAPGVNGEEFSGETTGGGTADTSLNPYRRAFLDTLAYAEGTANYPNTGYNTMFTGKQFSGYRNHPRQIQRSGRYASDAAGRYQFLSTTWDGLGLPDFSPANQDKGALKLLAPHVLQAIDKGDFATAFHGARKTWASLPGAGYGQPEKSMKTLVGYANNRLEKYKKGQIGSPTGPGMSDTKEGGQVGGDGKFIQGNSGASEGVHFHIGPGSQTKGTILQSQYNSDARSTALKAFNQFAGKRSVYFGRSKVSVPKGSKPSSGEAAKMIAREQQVHTAKGSQGGIDMQVDFEAKVPFPLRTTGMQYRRNGFGVSADIVGSNSFVAHGRYDEKGKVAPQELMRLYEKGGPTLAKPHVAMIGEKGAEYVIDADSYKATERVAPGLLDILNYDVHDKKSLQTKMPSIISSLSKYASYEFGGSSEVIVVDNSESSQGPEGGSSSGSSGMGLNNNTKSTYDPFNKLYAVG